MPLHAAQFFITPVLLLAARFYYAPRSKQKEREKCWCAGKFFIPAKKKSRQKEGALAENGLHVCRTIFTTSAAFLLASRVKKVTCVTQRFFWRQKEVTPVGYIRDSTRVHPSFLMVEKPRSGQPKWPIFPHSYILRVVSNS